MSTKKRKTTQLFKDKQETTERQSEVRASRQGAPRPDKTKLKNNVTSNSSNTSSQQPQKEQKLELNTSQPKAKKKNKNEQTSKERRKSRSIRLFDMPADSESRPINNVTKSNPRRVRNTEEGSRKGNYSSRSQFKGNNQNLNEAPRKRR